MGAIDTSHLIRLARSGDGGRALELAADLAPRITEPLDAARLAYASAVAHQMIGDPDQALVAAGEGASIARTNGARGLEVSCLSVATHAYADRERATEAVDALAQAVVVIESNPEPPPEDHDAGYEWAAGLLAHALAYQRVGLLESARVVLERLESFDHPGCHESYQVVTLLYRAMFDTASALTTMREHGGDPDPQVLRRAVEVAEVADAWGRRLDLRHVRGQVEIVRAVELAYLGDPAAAVALLDAIEPIVGVKLSELTSYLRQVAYLRSFNRLGYDREDPRVAALLGGSDLHDPLHPGSSILAWERLLYVHPEVAASPDSPWNYLSMSSVHQRQMIDTLDRLIRASASESRAADERDRLQEAATHDPLTGLLNRRGLEPVLARAAAARAGSSQTLFMIDLDRLKQVNDVSGHQRGDAVLLTIAETLKIQTRESDALARVGGDEFVLLADCGEVGARVLASRLCAVLVRDRDRIGGVTASIGAAVRTVPTDLDEWLRTADEAMYEVKRAGGNGMLVVQPEPDGDDTVPDVA